MMAERRFHYECSTCGATKDIVENTERTGQPLQANPPRWVPCGWRGCQSVAMYVDTVS